MRTRSFSLIALIAMLALALQMSSATRAQESTPTGGNEPNIDGGKIDPALVKGLRGGPLSQRAGTVKIVIELADQPAARVFADRRSRNGEAQATAAAKSQLDQIRRAQQTVIQALQNAAINAKVIYSTQRVYNGIAAKVDSSKLASIAKLPGVKAIHALNTKTLDNSYSVPLIGAPQVWSDASINAPTGEGISIGVIDTGIDYIHTDFGGSGLAATYTANNTTVNGEGFFPNGKVVGGYDFAGDDYDANDPDADTPAPDPDPMDCNGHGSHVAGTAAGYGVNANGTTYAGPWNTSTPFTSLRIGPGVAPEADLYALRVFGCGGSTDLTDQAIEWAVDPNNDGNFSDHLDVINMSLGSDYGSTYDTTAVASDAAAEVGVIVVTSAGNSGDTYYIGGSPGTAARAISTASSVDAADTFDGFRVNSPASIAGVKPGSESVNYNWTNKPPVTADLVYPPTQRSGCAAFTPANAALLAGKIALLDWTSTDGVNECGSVARVTNAANAGAVGAVLVYNQPELDIAISGSTLIPSIITLQSVGAQIKANLNASGTGVNVTLSPEFRNSTKVVDNAKIDTLSDFSSRGPRRGDSALKPDIAAPGQSIFSAGVLTGNQGESLNGTSMAAPHVAGSMALLRQLHPTWSVEELKALAMNTANTPVRLSNDPNSTKYGPSRVGAGRITLTEAVDSNVVAYNAEDVGQVSISFGVVEVVNSRTAVKNIRVVNKGNSSATYAVSYSPATDIPGVSFTVTPSSVTVGANSSANVVVTMTASAAAMRHTHDTTVAETQGAQPREWLSEESGRVVLTPSSGITLLVPVYAAARAASDMRAQTGTLNFSTNATGSTEVELAGTGIGSAAALTSPTAEDEVSIVTAYELQVSSPNEPDSAGIVNNADIKYVGVASNAKTATPYTNATIAFGIASHDNWSTPNEVEFDIYIDTNRDGNDDYVLFNWNYALATGGTDASDVFITYLANLNNPAAPPVVSYVNAANLLDTNTAVFNSSVMLLPVRASALGLTATSGAFDYTVVSFSRDADGVIDISPTVTYNPNRAGVDVSDGLGGLPAFLDLPNEEIPVDFVRTDYLANGSQGLLLLHHHNETGRQAEVVDVRFGLSYKKFLPTITR
jgi:subtilisin family serine protease